ncbi:MAG: exo-alpha-sialidase, partial [Acidobacteria bacterium]|nr:exo-alpha-sialidase [Acidobacteriota bacterium]
MPVVQPRRSTARRFAIGLTAAVALWSGVSLLAQIPGRNINMVAGTDWPGGDPFLQRQNEPSMAASTRNPLHLVAGSNDYRSVDVPGLPDGVETGDAWISVYKSFDGGQRWSSTLMPGYPQDTSPEGLASPLKGYQAGADPVVRAGTPGLIYYNGLVFNRGDNGRSGIFLARFIDRNNKENGDPIAYLGTSMVAASDGTTFLDKPWMVVDVPRGNTGFCRVGLDPTAVNDDDDDDDDHGRGGKVKRNGHRRRGRGDDRRRRNQPPDDGYQYVPAGAVYVAYTAITGDGPSLQAQIFVKRSLDCGATWSAPMRVSSPTDAINQGATLAISPSTGDLFVAWRRFSTPTVTDLDAVMVSRLRINGGSFDAPGRARGLRRSQSDDVLEKIFEHRKKRANPTVAASVQQIDQGTGPFRFRTNAYPAMAVDGTGRAYVAWSERGFATLRPDPVDGDARILVASTLDGRTFSAPVVADDEAQPGHQLMPSLAFSGGKLMLVYYDLRETAAQLFGRFIDDALSTNNKRHTIDIRAALGTPGAAPAFAPSVRVSDYLMGFRNGTSSLEKLQVNPPNLPMFKLGTVPFIGDYIDVTPAPAFVPAANGEWVYNTAPSGQLPIFHAVWTDNRDVRPPLDGNWSNYTPPTINGQFPATSIFDPTQQVAICRAGNAGSRNQNIYTARISGGLLVGSPSNGSSSTGRSAPTRPCRPRCSRSTRAPGRSVSAPTPIPRWRSMAPAAPTSP